MPLEEDRRRRQDALIQAGLTLASDLSLPSVLQKIIDLACQVADARFGALGVLHRDRRRLSDFITHGVTDEERRAIGTLPEGKGILGILIDEAHPLRLERIQDHPRSVGFPPNHPPMERFLGVPLMVRGQVFGNLYLTEKLGGEPFSQADEDAVKTLAAQAAVAIENARLYEELERLAVLEDRERIAQELHDGVIQSLFAVGMSLQAAEGMAGDPDSVRDRVGSAVDAIDNTIRDLRNYIFGLRPGAVADRNLAAALEELARGFGEGTGNIRIEHAVDPEVAARLSGRTSDVLQAAREAISNAARHSGASSIAVRLIRDAHAALLEIHDDGTGFDPGKVAGRGQGLSNLRSRATSMGGRLEIESGPEGTLIRIRFPM
jgi:signal transduction histidine kinase